MKKIITILCILLCLGSFTACDKNNGKEKADMLNVAQVTELLKDLDSTIESEGYKGAYNIISQSIDGLKSALEVEYKGDNGVMNYVAKYLLNLSTDSEGNVSVDSFKLASSTKEMIELSADQISQLLNIDLNGLKGKYELIESTVSSDTQNIKLKFTSDDGKYEAVYKTAVKIIDKKPTLYGPLDVEVLKDETGPTITAKPIDIIELTKLIEGQDSAITNLMTSKYTILSQIINGVTNTLNVSVEADSLLSFYEAKYTVKTSVNEKEELLLDSFTIDESKLTEKDILVDDATILKLIEGKDTNVGNKSYMGSNSIANKSAKKAETTATVKYNGSNDKVDYQAEYKVVAVTDPEGNVSLKEFNISSSKEEMKPVTCDIVNSLFQHDMNGLKGSYAMNSQDINGLSDKFKMTFTSDDEKYVSEYTGVVKVSGKEYVLEDLDINIVKNETMNGAPDNDPTKYISIIEKYYTSQKYDTAEVTNITITNGVITANVMAKEIWRYITDVDYITATFTANGENATFVSQNINNQSTISNFEYIYYNYDSNLVSAPYFSTLQLTSDWQYTLTENNSSGFSVVKGTYSINNTVITLKNYNKGLGMGANEPTTIVFDVISLFNIQIRCNLCTTQAGDHFECIMGWEE